MSFFRPCSSRSASILIVVAGLASLMAGLSLAFLISMRNEADEEAQFLDVVQVRVMLTAGLQYVNETGRIGWDDGIGPLRTEAFGWIDVRDGGVGPKDRDGVSLVPPPDIDGPRFPAVGGTARCPMYVMEQPPFATQLTTNYNPVERDPTKPTAELIHFDQPDPQPNLGQTITDYNSWAIGDRRPRANSLGRSWFRVHRKAPAVFVITCGSGSTGGFRSWSEVVAAGETATFADNRAQWEDARANEVIHWFEAEWSSAVGNNSRRHYYPSAYVLNPINGCPKFAQEEFNRANARQFTGTFRWIQRLFDQPAAW